MLDALESEVRTFDARFHEFMREHAGEVVLIQGTTVHGFFPDEPTAIREGYRKLGGPPFLAHRIEVQEPVVLRGHRTRGPSAR